MIPFFRKGFTLVEIITVVFIVWLLATSLYMGTQPYMKRSRDTKRITDMWSYINIIDTYNMNFETFPSNEWSGWSLIPGYCLSELSTRPSYVGFLDKQFQTLWAASVPPRDPSNLPAISPCDMTWSFLYSRIDYWVDKQIAVLAARLEQKTTANYGTGSELTSSWHVGDIITAKRWSVPEDSLDSIFVVYRMR